MTLADPAMTHRRLSPAAIAVAVLSLGVFMSSLDLFIVNLAFPYIGHDFGGTSLGALSWVLNGYTIAFAAVLVPAGRWADRIGRRRVFSTGLLAFTIGSAICGVAPDVIALVAARVLQAVGAGMMVPTSLSLLLAVVPPAGRARAIGTWSAVGALGAGLGPVVGGLLVQESWRLVFWVNVPVGLVALALAHRAIPESRDPNAHPRPDIIGALLVAASVGLLALAMVKAPEWGWLSFNVLGIAVLAVAGIAAVLAHSARHPAPIIELPLLRLRSFSGAFAVSILYYAGFGAFVLNSVEFLTGEWHYSAVRAGLAIAPGPLCVLPFARIVAPRLAVRIGGAGRVAVLGALVNAGSQGLWLHGLQASHAYASHLLPAQLIGGMGVGLTIPSLLGVGTAALPPAWFGTGSGVLNMARQVGSVLGVAALIGVLAAGHAPGSLTPYRHALEMIITFFVAAAAVAAALLTRAPAAVLATVTPVAPSRNFVSQPADIKSPLAG
ncbi:MAG TPA: DHA2 family efflux MFS transporter permease subunit [Mycobacteriales bacterium]|nr:DHA2 family efflux MFS transporter permease subunit [Mycobacteriales bacterium]